MPEMIYSHSMLIAAHYAWQKTEYTPTNISSLPSNIRRLEAWDNYVDVRDGLTLGTSKRRRELGDRNRAGLHMVEDVPEAVQG